jgi:ribulose-5-phosphate 4-epimerase/fuculose-1-phosphate aldolase
VIDEREVMAAVSGHPPATPAEAARQVAVACRVIARFGHEDLTLGHASVRGPDGASCYIKRKGKALSEVLPQDVMEIPLSQDLTRPVPGAHLETVMHTQTYLARADVGAVIHTHPLHSIAVGATRQGLAVLSHDGVLFAGGVPIFDGTAGMVTTTEDATAVARCLGRGRAVLLRNHGILVAGEDIRWAVLAAVTLERAARLQFVAGLLGDPVPIPPEQAGALYGAKYSDEFTDEYWTAWCRMVSDGRQLGLP